METQLAYCSACDQNVRIVVTDPPTHDGQANLHDVEVVCLEIGSQCTGALCPIGATSPTAMMARLVKSGLGVTIQPIITAQCGGCDRRTDHVVVDPKYATCGECGTTALVSELNVFGPART